MDDVTPGQPLFKGHPDRRAHPRMLCRGLVTANIQHSGPAQPVRDLSLSGFSVETPARLEPATLHHCAFHPDSGKPIAMLVQVARSDRQPGAPQYVTAFRFSLFEPDGQQRRDDLMSRFVRRAGFNRAAG